MAIVFTQLKRPHYLAFAIAPIVGWVFLPSSFRGGTQLIGNILLALLLAFAIRETESHEQELRITSGSADSGDEVIVDLTLDQSSNILEPHPQRRP